MQDKTPKEKFIVRWRIGQIEKFFETFAADVYVVSGMWLPHRHPRANILLGPAMAVRGLIRKALLHMTNADCAFQDYLRDMASTTGLNFGQLFGQLDGIGLRFSSRS